MLRIAIPNKGQLAEPAFNMLREAGYLIESTNKNLVVRDRSNDIEFFFLRPRDIAIYVASGNLDFGITGQDMVADSKADVQEILKLGFAKSFFTLAGPTPNADRTALNNKRIATSYPELLGEWLAKEKITARIIELDGAVENAVRLGVADFIADVVATGSTLQQAGLNPIGDAIMESEAILVGSGSVKAGDETDRFIRRVNSVIVARDFVLMDYDIPTELVASACLITPGFESPTVSKLRDDSWSAIRVMVPAKQLHSIMDELYSIGAKGILVTQIAACRL
jgi:ATP phosphoribosyltransferase